MIPAMFSNFNTGTVVMILLAAVIGIYLYRLDKKEKSDPLAALYKQYETLTPDSLAAVADGELVRAVAINVMQKTDKKRPDVYALIPFLSHGRVAVYSVWLLCHELETSSVTALLTSPSGCFLEPAADGLALIGAEASAAALTAVLEAPDDQTRADALHAALAAEDPLTLCVPYIRENPDEFVDL